MKRFILTGAPGSGKTAIIRQLELDGFSVVCTAALAAYLGYPMPAVLSRELDRIKAEDIFQKQVFFIRNLGFITPTEARRISFEETLRFEKIHEEIYNQFGFAIISIAPGSLLERAAAIKKTAGID
jgi:predicted ATPase